MAGLIALIVLVAIPLVFIYIYGIAKQAVMRRGGSHMAARRCGIAAVVIASLPITWDAIPTWVTYSYYAHTQAGIRIFKSLEQWSTEWPGVLETLEPYGLRDHDPRTRIIELPDGGSRTMLNARFSYDWRVERLALSTRSVIHEIADAKTGQVMVRWTIVCSGNTGGLASGGDGWWKFWLVHDTSTSEQSEHFEKQRRKFNWLRLQQDWFQLTPTTPTHASAAGSGSK